MFAYVYAFIFFLRLCMYQTIMFIYVYVCIPYTGFHMVGRVSSLCCCAF